MENGDAVTVSSGYPCLEGTSQYKEFYSLFQVFSSYFCMCAYQSYHDVLLLLDIFRDTHHNPGIFVYSEVSHLESVHW